MTGPLGTESGTDVGKDVGKATTTGALSRYDPGWTRTSGLRIRNPTLYPPELRGQRRTVYLLNRSLVHLFELAPGSLCSPCSIRPRPRALLLPIRHTSAR